MIRRQPRHLIAVLLHPAGKMRCFSGPLLVTKITGDESFSHGQSGVGREDHVRQFRLRLDQENPAIELLQGALEAFPLLLRHGYFGAALPAHPGINFVFDAVMIRRT